MHRVTIIRVHEGARWPIGPMQEGRPDRTLSNRPQSKKTEIGRTFHPGPMVKGLQDIRAIGRDRKEVEALAEARNREGPARIVGRVFGQEVGILDIALYHHGPDPELPEVSSNVANLWAPPARECTYETLCLVRFG